MSVELTLLLWSTALLAAHIGVQSLLYRAQYSIRYSSSARDDEPPPNRWTARADKALRNLLETYPAFAVLVLVVELTDRSGTLTVWGAHVYFWARWVYLPLYIFGVQWFRSLVWCVGAVGLILMFAGVLFPAT